MGFFGMVFLWWVYLFCYIGVFFVNSFGGYFCCFFLWVFGVFFTLQLLKSSNCLPCWLCSILPYIVSCLPSLGLLTFLAARTQICPWQINFGSQDEKEWQVIAMCCIWWVMQSGIELHWCTWNSCLRILCIKKGHLEIIIKTGR